MRRYAIRAVLVLAIATSVSLAAEEGLVGSWTFDEGSGTVVRDHSGQGNDGAIKGGATFVKRGEGSALYFDGKDGFVDCGNGASLDLTKAITLEAWIKPESLPAAEPMVIGKHYDSYGLTHYRDGNFWSYISSGGNKVRAQAAVGRWSHVVSVFDGQDMTMYLGHQQVDHGRSRFDAIVHGGSFLMGMLLADPASTDPGYSGTAFWRGTLDNVRVYNRALTAAEVVAHYKAEAGGFGVDTAGFDRATVSLYPSRTAPRLVAVVDVSGVFERPSGSRLEVALRRVGETDALVSQSCSEVPRSGRWCAKLDLPLLAPGEYAVAARLTTPDGRTYDGDARLRYPLPPLVVPPPAQRPAMPTVRDTRLPYVLQVQPGGGFTVSARGVTWPVVSTFSYPNGGDNRLVCGPRDGGGEASWVVTPRLVTPGRWEVTARGKYYSLQRLIRAERQRVLVTDTLRNESGEDVGIMFRHALDATKRPWERSWIAGYPCEGERDQCYSASVFGAWSATGMGVIPLDDLAIIQGHLFAKDGQLGYRDERLGLPPGDSQTFEWAVYPTASTDYYDFINQVRRDEGRNRMTVAGGWNFIPQTPPVSREYADTRNLLYAAFGCLLNVADDPEIEIEGIDFLWLPKERARLKERFAAIRQANPQLKLMFHVAHTLLSTNKPAELFPDSRVVDEQGEHLIWSYDYFNGAYFTKRRAEEGWRWYAYYPTPGNSFHEALMKSVDSMVDDITCNGAFMDGFFCGYVSPWTYDRWDRRTVRINPETKQVEKRYGSVLWLSQPSMVEFTKRMVAKGGVVVANNAIMTRTIGRLPIITDQECRSGPDVHLAPTPCALGDPTNIRGEADVYDDVLDKLRWGVLYFYYNEGTLTYPSLPQQQYPITIESIHAGTVRGRERIVTMNPGVYGWPGGRDLHLAYRYNNVGVPIPADFVTSVDAAGVRTEVALADRESAALVRVPARLEADQPLNVVLSQYDAEGVALALSGQGRAVLALRNGAFGIIPGATYQLGDGRALQAGASGLLQIPIWLEGQQTLTVKRL